MAFWDMDKFTSYTIADFLDDLSFVTYIKTGNDTPGNSWSEWLKSSPPNIDAYHQAREYLLVLLSAPRILPDENFGNQLFKDITLSINKAEQLKSKKRIMVALLSGIAASIMIVVGMWWYYQSKIVITTAYGQQLTVELPDRSKVKLNANSSLQYYRAWNWHQTREVWLTGEALFIVRHLNKNIREVTPKQRFTAYTDNLQIQVLGTTFNVKNRRGKTQVSLIEGKIRLTSVNQHINQSEILYPGQTVNYDQQRLINVVDNHQLTSEPLGWVNRQILSKGITVGEIINDYEDTYGGHIVPDDNAMKTKRIDGTISLKTKESTLYMLANLLDAYIEVHADTIYLKSKKN